LRKINISHASFDAAMTENLIKGAFGNLHLASMKMSKRDVAGAIKALDNSSAFLMQANEPELARECSSVSDILRGGDWHKAQALYTNLYARVSQIFSRMQSDLKDDKRHLRMVNEVKCSECFKMIPADSNFCSYCGKRQLKCLKCGNHVLISNNFCGWCGYRLRG
jgi:hypothetical protein